MKHSSPTHVLGLLLAAAAATTSHAHFTGEPHNHPHDSNGARGSAFGGHERGIEHHHDLGHHHHHGEDKNAHTHDMLRMHVLGAAAGAGTLEEDGGAELLHPLAHYVLGFFEWTFKYGHTWGNFQEALHALRNYARADDKIAQHQDKDSSYTLAHNAFSHMSWQEFRQHFFIGKDMVTPEELPVESALRPRGEKAPKAFFIGQDIVTSEGAEYALEYVLRPRGEKAPKAMLRGEDIPTEVDWVAKGGVTPVKNQGSCGSCWSFSTTGAMEGAHFIKTGKLEVFSEQELVDCDTYDMGCNGGLMDYSFHWIQQNGGICSEEDYPYTAEGGICKKTTCDVVEGTMVDKWVDVDHENEEALMQAVAQQPVSIAIEADQMSFQLYSGGVLTAECGTNLDHGVLLVGYGVSEDGIKYWKVKNSWGPEWGAEGYILLQRDGPQEGGECGILEQASYPVLA